MRTLTTQAAAAVRFSETNPTHARYDPPLSAFCGRKSPSNPRSPMSSGNQTMALIA
ncbi:MAG: hypothetical protein WCA22_16735 [Candidatus Binatus sp.]